MEANVVSGNLGGGVVISGSFNKLSGNFIGTNSLGTGAVGNGGNGVSLEVNAQNNFVGTDGDRSGDSLEGNVISGNGRLWEQCRSVCFCQQ